MQLAEWTPGLVSDLPFDTQNGTDTPLAAALHPAGRLLAVRSSRYVQLLDVLSEQGIDRLPANGWKPQKGETVKGDIGETAKGDTVLIR